MSTDGTEIGRLPHALEDASGLRERMAGKRLDVSLDYDGTLAPIVDRPEDAIISDEMREVVRALAHRCPLCVVSGRDRMVVQQLMGVDDLVVAGSHGFAIWSPEGGAIEREEGAGSADRLWRLTRALRDEVATVEGALVEPRKRSVASNTVSSTSATGPGSRSSSTGCRPRLPSS